MSQATEEKVSRRHGGIRTILFSFIGSLVFPVVTNLLDPLAAQNESDLILGISPNILVSMLIMIPVASIVSLLVVKGVAETGSKQGSFFLPFTLRIVASFLLMILLNAMGIIIGLSAL